MRETAGKEQAQLGAVQETLFIPLAARARESRRKRPVLRDPKAAELIASIDFDAAKYDSGFGGPVMVLRTAIYDFWVRQFLAEHPAGTVVELGTGLNTRFDRVDNGQVHWIDLDLPDAIELRGRFFTDTSRRRMVASSVLSEEWLPAVAGSPGPYFFVTGSRRGSPARGSRWTPTRGGRTSTRISWPGSGASRAGSGRVTTRGHCSGSVCGWTSRPP